jgi:sec-independent protein translocase protein TatB
MGSLGTGEILVIILVAIIVFGPQRLPEISRKAGELLAKARQMAHSLADSVDSEYGDITTPIKDLKSEYDATVADIKGVASSTVSNLSVEMPTVDLKKQDRATPSADGAIPDGAAAASSALQPTAPEGDSAAEQVGAPDDDPRTGAPEDRAS